MAPLLDAEIIRDPLIDGNIWRIADANIPNTSAGRFAPDLRHWRPGLRSADADLLPDRRNLLTRSRDLERNDGIADGGIQSILDNVVGSGFILIPDPNYDAIAAITGNAKFTKAWSRVWAKKARALWRTWAYSTACDITNTQNFDQLTSQVLRAKQHGEFFARAMWRDQPRNGWHTAIQTIDTDRLSTPAMMMDSDLLRSGVSFDTNGAPIGYYIRNRHPNDLAYATLGIGAFPAWAFVPKETVFGRPVGIHGFDKERAAQSRGRAALASVLANFKGLNRYTSAEIQAAVLNAAIAMTIQTPMDQASIAELFHDRPVDYLKQRATYGNHFEFGQVAPLFPGDELKAWSPNRPTSGFDIFMENVGRIIAVAMGIPYEILFKDFTKSNYSAMKAAMGEAFRTFQRMQDDAGSQWADPCYSLVIEEAINDGRLDGEGFYDARAAYLQCEWIGPARGYVDETKESTAVQTRLDCNTTTLRRECAKQGQWYEDTLEQRAEELEMMRTLKIPHYLSPGILVPDNDAPGGADGVGGDAAQPTSGGPPKPPSGAPQQAASAE